MEALPGETLRAAVRQRLVGVLEEVLGLIQTTVDHYESQLGQSRAREEESERLRGARALLLLTEATEKPREDEKEPHSETIVKEEEPDPWSISEAQTLPAKPAPGPKSAPPPSPPPPTTAQPLPHEQSHGKLPGNHKTESEDSDEECPICRRLEQKEELESAAIADSTGAGCDGGECARTSDHKEQLAPQEFETMQVKSEEEDHAFADGADKPLDVERKEEGERSTEAATNRDRETSSEAKDETAESEKEISSSLGDDLTRATDGSTLETTRNEAPKENALPSSSLSNPEEEERSLSIVSKLNDVSDVADCSDVANKPLENVSGRERGETEEGRARKDLKRSAATDPGDETAPKCQKTSSETREETAESENVVDASSGKDSEDATEREIPCNEENGGLDARSSRSPLSNPAEVELPAMERNEESAKEEPKRLESKLLGAEDVNAKDRAQSLKQRLVINLPTVRLMPLQYIHIAVRNKGQSTNSSGRPKSPQRIIGEKLKEKELDQRNVVQNSENSHKAASGNASEKPASVAARDPEPVKVPSASSPSPTRVSQKENGEKSGDLSSRKQKKRKAKTKARTELQNHPKEALEKASDKSDAKVDNSSNSRRSKDGVSKTKNGKAKSLAAVKPGSSPEKRGTKSLTSSSNGGSRQKTEGHPQKSSDGNASKAHKTKGSESKKRQRLKSKDGHDCSECGTTFALKGNLLKHLIVHREERPFSCSQCDATFKRKLNLKAHMSTHSEVKEFECPICKKMYTRKSNLGEHMKCHSEQKPFSCSVCGHRFTSSSNLRRHAMSHSGLRPFRCEVCGKSFGRRSILREHMVSHSREQPFACAVCRTKFARKSNLMKHMRLHDDERQHKCPDCGAAFSQKVHLNQHMFQHTGEKPFRCSICGKGFTRKSYIRQHRAMYCLGPTHERVLAHERDRALKRDRALEPGRALEPDGAHVKTRSSAHDQDRAHAKTRSSAHDTDPHQDTHPGPAHEQDRAPVNIQSPSHDRDHGHVNTPSPAGDHALSKTQSPALEQDRTPVNIQSPSHDQDHGHVKTPSPTHEQDHAHRQGKEAETEEGQNGSSLNI